MGACLDCCRGSDPSYDTPNEEERRQKMIEAAEKRRREQETRGLKDGLVGVERVERNKQRALQVESALENSNSDATLRWQVS